MQIFLFIVNGKPGYRLTLEAAQACLEDHLRSRRDITDVWWDDESPYEARTYLYGASHSDFEAEGYDAEISWETTDQLIWPVMLSPEVKSAAEKLDSLFPSGAEMIMSIKTDKGKCQFVRHIPLGPWAEKWMRPRLITDFATEAGQSLAAHWTNEEST